MQTTLNQQAVDIFIELLDPPEHLKDSLRKKREQYGLTPEQTLRDIRRFRNSVNYAAAVSKLEKLITESN